MSYIIKKTLRIAGTNLILDHYYISSIQPNRAERWINANLMDSEYDGVAPGNQDGVLKLGGKIAWRAH